MKLTHKLGGAALVAVAGVALAIPSTTKAKVSSLEGTGKITFTYDNTEEITIVDPGTTTTQTTITNISPVNPGEMGIIAVTPLEFGAHKSIASTKVYDYYAQSFVANPDSDNTDEKVIEGNTQRFETANFVSFQDFRPDKNHNYTISAAITQQFTTAGTEGKAGRTMDGATLMYNNATVVKADNDNSYTIPRKVNSGVKVELNKSAVIVENLAITEGEKVTETGGDGYGRFNLVFGGIKATDTTKAAESIKLTVPSSTIVTAGEYSAVVTWTMSDSI